MRKLKKQDYTLLELLVGIILVGIIAQIICVIVSQDYLYNAIGLWSGVAIACFMAIHLKRSLEESLDLGVEEAVKSARTGYATRMTVAVIAMGVVIGFNLGNPITVLVGALTLKISAYLEPHMHKLFLRIEERKNETKI